MMAALDGDSFCISCGYVAYAYVALDLPPPPKGHHGRVRYDKRERAEHKRLMGFSNAGRKKHA